jgi:hypothetical protein
LSEIITHTDFAELLAAMEIFIDRKITPNMEIVNASYKMSIDIVNRQSVTAGRDEYIATLKEEIVDPDDYLRFRVTRRFEKIAQSLYDEHEKEAMPSKAGQNYYEQLQNQLQIFQ